MSPVSSFDPDALRRARLAAGLTQSQLAHRIGVAGAERISMWERGEVPPGSAARLRALGRALKVPPDTFLTTPTVHAEDETDFLRLRIHAGISREDLARRAGVSAATVNRWETGQYVRLPKAETVRLLARALHTTMSHVRDVLAAGARPPAPRRRPDQPT